MTNWKTGWTTSIGCSRRWRTRADEQWSTAGLDRPASVSEFAKPFAMSLAAVVQHVQVLEASGLVRSEKTGRVRTCQLAPDVLQGAERWISERRTAWEHRLDRLGHYLAENPEGTDR